MWPNGQGWKEKERKCYSDICCFGLFWLLILGSFGIEFFFEMNLNRMDFCFLLIFWLCDGRLG
jgi:hypothetical protein